MMKCVPTEELKVYCVPDTTFTTEYSPVHASVTMFCAEPVQVGVKAAVGHWPFGVFVHCAYASFGAEKAITTPVRAAKRLPTKRRRLNGLP